MSSTSSTPSCSSPSTALWCWRSTCTSCGRWVSLLVCLFVCLFFYWCTTCGCFCFSESFQSFARALEESLDIVDRRRSNRSTDGVLQVRPRQDQGWHDHRRHHGGNVPPLRCAPPPDVCGRPRVSSIASVSRLFLATTTTTTAAAAAAAAVAVTLPGVALRGGEINK